MRSLRERILDEVTEEDRGFSTPCWVWTGATRKANFAKIAHLGPPAASRQRMGIQ